MNNILLQTKYNLKFFQFQMKDAFLHSSPMVIRLIMCLYLIVMGAWMWNIGDWAKFPALAAQLQFMPKSCWVASFEIIGLLQLWRLFDTPDRTRVKIAAVINGAMFVLMLADAVARSTIGDPAAGGPIIGTILSAWITLRTGYNVLDKVRA